MLCIVSAVRLHVSPMTEIWRSDRVHGRHYGLDVLQRGCCGSKEQGAMVWRWGHRQPSALELFPGGTTRGPGRGILSPRRPFSVSGGSRPGGATARQDLNDPVTLASCSAHVGMPRFTPTDAAHSR